MKQKYPHLCAPITLGRVVFRNRMFSAPMGGTDITADCCVGPRTPGFYELRAKGGAAAVARHGAVPSVELSHSGQYAGTYLIDKEKKKELVQYGLPLVPDSRLSFG